LQLKYKPEPSSIDYILKYLFKYPFSQHPWPWMYSPSRQVWAHTPPGSTRQPASSPEKLLPFCHSTLSKIKLARVLLAIVAATAIHIVKNTTK